MTTCKATTMSYGNAPADRLALLLLTFAVLILAGCGDTVSGSDTPGGGGSSVVPLTSVLQLNVGDDPCDRVASLVLNFTSVNLKNSGGGAVSVLNGSSSVEFMHLLGSYQSLSLVDVPRGNYSGADISIASASISYLSPLTGELTQQNLTGPWSVPVVFSPPMSVTDTSVALNLHLAVGDSVSLDGNGNLVFNPVFTPDIFQGGSVAGHNRQYGGLDHATGRVTSIAGNSFQLAMMQSQRALTVQTGSSTTFDGLAGMNALAAGMIVTVDADLQSDGTLFAQQIHLAEHDTGGMAASGIIVSATGTPVTQLVLIADDLSGSGTAEDDMGANVTASLSSNTIFRMDSAGVDLSGLPFVPEFSGSSLFSGQAVEIVSGSGMMHDGSGSGDHDAQHSSASVTEVHLEQQGIRGTVSDLAPSGKQPTFILKVAPESFFSHLTGATTVRVFQQPDTQIWGSGTISEGASVIVHGLLFGGSDSYKLVASRIVVH